MRKVLRIIRGKLVFIVPLYWLDTYGFLKPEAICALAVFFGDKTNEEANKVLVKRKESTRKGWYL